MHGKNTSVSATIAEPPEPEHFSESFQESTGTSIELDFFSAEFNNIDELDDTRGNYRSFQYCGGNALSSSQAGSFPLVKVDSVFTSGSFGGFSATVAGTDGILVNISILIGQSSCGTGIEAGFYDLVLDLQSMPAFTGKLLPVGYYAPGEDKIRLDAALLELPEMRGRFTKP